MTRHALPDAAAIRAAIAAQPPLLPLGSLLKAGSAVPTGGEARRIKTWREQAKKVGFVTVLGGVVVDVDGTRIAVVLDNSRLHYMLSLEYDTGRRRPLHYATTYEGARRHGVDGLFPAGEGLLPAIKTADEEA